MTVNLSDAARALLVAKITVTPGLLRRAPAAIAGRYAHEWAPAEILAAQLARWPAGLLRFLAAQPHGRITIDEQTAYESDAGEPHRNVVQVALADLGSPVTCLSVVANWLDHLLGCAGAPAGLWLSDGGGTTAEMAELGGRICRLYDLGYAVDEESRCDRHAYFARSLAWYAVDRRRLNVADPQMDKSLKNLAKVLKPSQGS